MYLSMRHYQVDPAHIDEILRRVESGFVPIIRQAPGFIAFYAVDMGNGMLTSISVFQDRAAAEASVQMAASHISLHIAELFPSPPLVQAGIVRILAAAGDP